MKKHFKLFVHKSWILRNKHLQTYLKMLTVFWVDIARNSQCLNIILNCTYPNW